MKMKRMKFQTTLNPLQMVLVLATFVVLLTVNASADYTARIKTPNGGEKYRPGTSQTITWDTTGVPFSTRWKFQFGTTPVGPWTDLQGLTSVKDSGSTRGQFAGGFRIPAIGTNSAFLRMEEVGNAAKSDVSDGPFSISSPTVIHVDSTLRGEITGTVVLHRTKVYGLDGYVYVNDGGKLIVEPGTIVVGDTVGQNSVLCVNRGGIIIAEGTKNSPIIFTSRAAPGQRERGDWGGIVICGKARTNHPGGQSQIEGGIADPSPGKGWFGGQNDNDSSGSLKYVRIEFAGIAVAPNNELNSLTLGAVGRGTQIDYVQCSYSNDDAFEWFGGTVNAKHLVAFGTLDDDFDTDNGFSGMVQFGLVKRFQNVADVSTSQSFESDNDASASFNQPMTRGVFSNITSIGPIQDTSWTPGNGATNYNSRFGAAAQIRRNSRLSIHNTIFLGWPRGLEIAQTPTMAAALADSVFVRNCSFFGIKTSVFNLAGGTAPAGFDLTWINKAAFNNQSAVSSPNLAQLKAAFGNGFDLNPVPYSTAPYLTTASFAGGGASRIDDPFFEHVEYEGAFSQIEQARWDAGWTNYDPVNTEYKASVNVMLTSPGATAGEKYVKNTQVDIRWDTTGTKGQHFMFEYGTSITGPWAVIDGATDVVDDGATRGILPKGFMVPDALTTSGYIKMTSTTDPTSFDISNYPFSIINPPTVAVRLIEPGTKVKSIRVGQSTDITWDTAGTYQKRWRLDFGHSATGPWRPLPGLSNVLDSGSTRGRVAGSVIFRPEDVSTMGYIRMALVSDTTKFDVNDQAFAITGAQNVVVDSTLHGEITGKVKLYNTKIYGIDGYVYVMDGAELVIEPGTIIVGDTVGQNSVLCINRGGKLIARGTPNLPIIFTSRAKAGDRVRGDWGGIVLCGKARTNHPGGESQIEGGIADPTPGKGWFGGQNDDDSSGVLAYVRIEFGGIAVAPNNELNGLTFGAVGNKTEIHHVQVSHANDDSFEWFGGAVNAKYLVAYGSLDDDFDTDNGFSGKVQHVLGVRFNNVADVSTSQAFESDNDSKASYNQPLTSATFSNVTSIGPVQDTAWTPGNGANNYNSRFGAAVQIRRNSRLNIHNSIFVGWPRGIEIAQTPTMDAAAADSFNVRNNSWYGVKTTWLNLAGGTAPAGMNENWISKPAYGNTIDKSTPNAAMLTNPFGNTVEFDPTAKNGSPVLSGTNYDVTANSKISDAYFDRATYRGAFDMQRWDLPWAEYDPVNVEYKAQPAVSVQEGTYATAGTVVAFPNPSAEVTNVRYTLNYTGKTTVRVVDPTGATRSAFIVGMEQAAGVYEFSLLTRDLANGIYYVHVISEHGTLTVPVSVIH